MIIRIAGTHSLKDEGWARAESLAALTVRQSNRRLTGRVERRSAAQELRAGVPAFLVSATRIVGYPADAAAG